MFKYFLRKEVTDRYLGNSSALLWVILHPLATLLIYNFVFGILFKARVPDLPQDAFITYLAVGLWPWMAFSDSVLNSISAVVNRKDLLGKVKIDLRNVVIAGTTANFLLHGIGFIAIVILLALMGRLSLSFDLFYLLLPLGMLYLMAICFSLLFSAFFVFYRDLKQIVSALLPLLFFCTPIIYSWTIIPDAARPYFSVNPLLPVFNLIHDITFGLDTLIVSNLLIVMVLTLLLLFFANWFFKKLAPRFDDFA